MVGRPAEPSRGKHQPLIGKVAHPIHIKLRGADGRACELIKGHVIAGVQCDAEARMCNGGEVV